MPKGQKIFRGKGGQMPPDTQRDFFDDEEPAVMSEQEEEVQEELVDDDTPDLEVLPATQEELLPEISASYSQKRLEFTREGSPVLEVSAKRVKLERRYTSMNPKEEDELMQWYRDNELLYNKKLSSFRNRARKTELKEAQAKKMGKTVEALENWMLNMRTRYAKLIDDKSGMATREMTERDQWIYNSFDFLRPHIVRCPTRSSKKVVSVARPTQEASQTSAPVSVPPHVSRPGSASTSASAEIDDPPPPPPGQDVLQERLERAISMQQELMETQRPKELPLAARLIRDAHTFADTYLANATEDIARAYSLEVIKLATGFVEFGNKQSNFRQKVQLVPPLDPMASTSLSFSPLLQQQQQPRHHQLQRSSWGGQTPSYGSPAATPVAERQAAEELSFSFLRDVNFDTV